MAEMLLIK